MFATSVTLNSLGSIILKIDKYKIFIDTDKDGDGFVNFKEYYKYEKSKKENKKSIKSDIKIKKNFKKFDKNNSGKISMRGEFLDIKN